ncbi:hypothetical protein K461DRAFT_297115 [Myriangium duriaei CBS 260.36]|uniref:Rhodopsin domain-containing protein n=1 Tax=Myriangium duriaei CBS 260.36 TaxID=1168546 RepID=A0A9P4MDY5_9PEZI|nr:hypothetical protein K461DRAFT_297115 [Myriangium duriaei CBS 260.36]
MAATADPLEVFIASITHIQNVAIVFLVLIIASVSIRMYVRVYMTKKFKTEDWAMVATFVVAVAHVTMAIVICQYSVEALRGHTVVSRINSYLLKTSGVTYILNLILLKISLGYFFLDIFTYQLFQRTVIYAIMILSAAIGFAYFPIANFTCAQLKPLPGTSDDCSIQKASSILLILFSLTNILGDFAFMLMAIVALWAAKLPTITKISTIILLCLGSTGGVASVIRLVICLEPTTLANYSKQNLDLLRWIVIELGFSVVATNLALIRPLFHAILSKLGLTNLSFGGNTSNAVELFSDERDGSQEDRDDSVD